MVKQHSQAVPLAKKIAFVRRARNTNYRSSLKLEGFDVSGLANSSASAIKSQLIERYRCSNS